jgi:polyhydroxyalkanoate synthesis regulator protein
MRMFNPFMPGQGAGQATQETTVKPDETSSPAKSSSGSDQQDLEELRAQIRTMQSQIEKLAGKP